MAKKKKFVKGKTGKTKNGHIFDLLKRKCLRCNIKFNTIWKRKLYCSRKCYMVGLLERTKIWCQTKDGIKWKKEYRLKYFRQKRIRALIKLGGKCKRCGYDDLRALHIDHVNNDGHKERNKRRSIENLIWQGKVDLKRYQILCANCNWIKRIEDTEVGKDDYNDYLKNISKNFSLSKKQFNS